MATIENNAVSTTICLEFVRSAPTIAAAMLMLAKKFAECEKRRCRLAEKKRQPGRLRDRKTALLRPFQPSIAAAAMISSGGSGAPAPRFLKSADPP
jgi:hypothetical protein